MRGRAADYLEGMWAVRPGPRARLMPPDSILKKRQTRPHEQEGELKGTRIDA